MKTHSIYTTDQHRTGLRRVARVLIDDVNCLVCLKQLAREFLKPKITQKVLRDIGYEAVAKYSKLVRPKNAYQTAKAGKFLDKMSNQDHEYRKNLDKN